MAYRRIVVATDGSASAETAEHVAATLAAALGAKLTIAHAYANPDRAGDAVERAEEIAEREGALHEVALSAEAPGRRDLDDRLPDRHRADRDREHGALGLRAALRQRVAPGRDPRAVRTCCSPGRGPTTSGRTAPRPTGAC